VLDLAECAPNPAQGRPPGLIQVLNAGDDCRIARIGAEPAEVPLGRFKLCLDRIEV
jgi:hypothetical protein